MAFKPIKYDNGDTVTMLQKASVTVARFDALDITAGFALRGTSSSTEIRYVSLQDQTSGASNPELLCVRTPGVLFEADTNTAPVQATDVGVKADLTDHDTLNESASVTDVFYIESIKGAAADKKVLGQFVMKIV